MTYKNLPSKDLRFLEKLELVWRSKANQFFRKKFNKDYYDFGAVIGAKVEIWKPGQFYAIKWRGTGQTGEEEAYNEIKPNGRLD
jgi:hypothetical protein